MKINNQAMISFSVNRYQKNEKLMGNSIEKLASGTSISRASDNAAGLAISETMRAQLRGLSRSQSNMQDGLSVLQVANEGLNNVNTLLQRGRELAVMNATDTLSTADREASQLELDQLMKSINDTANTLEFNTKGILGANQSLALLVGANPGQQINIELMDTSTTALNLDNVSLATRADAENSISKFDSAIKITTRNLTKVGSYYEAIEHHMYNSLINESNLTTSFSKLKDTDIAKEMINNISLSIRQNSDKILVSKVNQSLTEILSLFKK
ncbi:flagellin [Cytobacillus eiseniae]|uniref:Flagellin n=1 Tax=Cytobacillus eiseniae TaxID=762947 RepID=A0ABS4RI73_9BACI|nr:flagellin [Cytobacillus eiseniae]MBP2241994.1 flagellin [Cytobacillus eiseniae]